MVRHLNLFLGLKCINLKVYLLVYFRPNRLSSTIGGNREMDQLYTTSHVWNITRKTTFSSMFSKIKWKSVKTEKGHKIPLISLQTKHFVITFINNLVGHKNCWHLWRQNTAVLRVYKFYAAIYCTIIYLGNITSGAWWMLRKTTSAGKVSSTKYFLKSQSPKLVRRGTFV